MVNKRKTKLNNSGMSLVEVIIAVTILGIVVVPVLHSLTTAMVYNSKARIRQEMTLKAESIMESFKGYSLKELNTKFSTGAGLDELTGVTYTPAGNPATFLNTVPAKGDTFTFAIDDVQDVKGNKYRVVITATANEPEKVICMENMNAATDAIYDGGGSERQYEPKAKSDVVQDFKDNHLNDFYNNNLSGKVKVDGDTIEESDVENDVEGYIKLTGRKTKFDIKEDSGNYVVEMLMEYQYCIDGYPYYDAKTVTTPPDAYDPSAPTSTDTVADGDEKYTSAVYYDYTMVASSKVYERPVADGLNCLYIYYYPQYELEIENDVIEINNVAAIPDFDCYIMKQRAKDINASNTTTKESRYRPKLVAGANPDKCNIYHNFLVNIGDDTGGTKVVSGDAGAVGAGFGTVQSIRGNSGALDFPDTHGFVQKEVVSYNLQLTVTNGAGTTVTTLSSSKLN